MLRDIFVSLFHLANVQFRKSFSFLERDGWRVVAASSIFFASAGGESSAIPLRLLSPQSLTTLRGPLLGTRRRHGARNLFGENGNGKQNGGNA